MTPLSRDELIGAIAAGESFKYLFFWGHHPQRDGSMGPGCLSQWWPAAFMIDGVRYPTAEHWMMAAKARLFGDDDTLQKILAAGSPGAAKALGRSVHGFDDATWERHRFEIVARGSVAKFGQSDDLRAYLLATSTRVLVEASPVDRVWGIGLDATNARASDPRTWNGENLLGFALMAAREQLR